ncbi:hypothetical protein [Burkholderia ubonensis]|uniref:hypothetical protein n=1 Tax=Burkholderia ubonensis TaxID=101571 RepID=UPI000B142E81|nr:hypothetical protein [Burkholderia ubonensis]
MKNTPRSARQLETLLTGCIERSAAYANSRDLGDQARAFTAHLCGALEAQGYLALAKGLAHGAGMAHLYPAEGA